MSSTLTSGTDQELAVIAKLLVQAWSRDTSADPDHWSHLNRALGQCAVTALVVQDLVGGELVRAKIGASSHYWNQTPLGEVDLTRRQFGQQAALTSAELRSRDYVLSNSDTRRRYELLKARLASMTNRRAGRA